MATLLAEQQRLTVYPCHTSKLESCNLHPFLRTSKVTARRGVSVRVCSRLLLHMLQERERKQERDQSILQNHDKFKALERRVHSNSSQTPEFHLLPFHSSVAMTILSFMSQTDCLLLGSPYSLTKNKFYKSVYIYVL